MHDINIPKQIIEACIKKRGRLHVFDKIEVKKTSLIVIDMQNSWIVSGLSALEIPNTRSIIPNINKIAKSLRNAGGIVSWTQSTFDCSWTREMYSKFSDEMWIQKIMQDTKPGSYGFQINEAMDLQPTDIVSTKYRPSAFIQGSSDIDMKLMDKGCDTLIICGTLTNACCESSARDAAALGYKVLFLSDGTATRSDIEHNASLINLMQLVADVRTTEEVINLIEKNDFYERSEKSSSITPSF